jgi:putative endonuclease
VIPVANPTPAQASGGAAEETAEQFLGRHGLTIVARNYRTRRGEIDLIARDGDSLVFVEVRYRSSEGFGGALESITRGKQSRIIMAARQYLMGLATLPPCRFDVVCLDDLETTWIRGAFDAT